MTVWWLIVGFIRGLFLEPRTPRQLARRTERNKIRVLKRLRRYSFYRGLELASWDRVPIFEKRAYLASFRGLNEPGLSLEEVRAFGEEVEARHDERTRLRGHIVGLSTGTSGARSGYVLGSREAGMWAGSILAKLLGLGVFRPQKIAFVFRTHGPLYKGADRGWIRLRFFDLNGRPEEIDRGLREFQPDIVVSVPNFYVQYMARSRRAEISPKLLVSGADVLEAHERSALQEFFGSEIREVYQATEGFLGVGCAAGRVHLNEADYVVERQAVGEGGAFRPIVTDVQRRSQAIVRFLMDDVLIPHEGPCPCGQPSLSLRRIEGRADQVLKFRRDEAGPSVVIYPDFLRRLLRESECFDWNYRVQQTSLQSLRLELDRALEAKAVEHVRESLRAAFAEKGAPWIGLEIAHRTEFPVERGKRRRIEGLAP